MYFFYLIRNYPTVFKSGEFESPVFLWHYFVRFYVVMQNYSEHFILRAKLAALNTIGEADNFYDIRCQKLQLCIFVV